MPPKKSFRPRKTKAKIGVQANTIVVSVTMVVAALLLVVFGTSLYSGIVSMSGTVKMASGNYSNEGILYSTLNDEPCKSGYTQIGRLNSAVDPYGNPTSISPRKLCKKNSTLGVMFVRSSSNCPAGYNPNPAGIFQAPGNSNWKLCYKSEEITIRTTTGDCNTGNYSGYSLGGNFKGNNGNGNWKICYKFFNCVIQDYKKSSDYGYGSSVWSQEVQYDDFCINNTTLEEVQCYDNQPLVVSIDGGNNGIKANKSCNNDNGIGAFRETAWKSSTTLSVAQGSWLNIDGTLDKDGLSASPYAVTGISGGSLYISSNYGKNNWRSIRNSAKNWKKVQVGTNSGNSVYVSGLVVDSSNNGKIWYTTNNRSDYEFGYDWLASNAFYGIWSDYKMSDNARCMMAVASEQIIYSKDYGISFAYVNRNDFSRIGLNLNNDEFLYRVAVSKDCESIYLLTGQGRIFRSLNSGDTWLLFNSLSITNEPYFYYDISDDGKYQAIVTNGNVFLSTDYGSNFVPISQDLAIKDISVNNYGRMLTATQPDNNSQSKIYESNLALTDKKEIGSFNGSIGGVYYSKDIGGLWQLTSYKYTKSNDFSILWR